MSPIWVKFLANWGEITLKIDRFHEAFTQRHKRVCYSQKIYPRSPKNLHGYIRHIRDIFQLCTVKGEEAIEIHGVGFTIDWNKTPMIVMKIMIPLL